MKASKDGLGDRMKKNYEDRSRFHLMRRVPVMIRLDGKAFHTFTKNLQKPFDERFLYAMRWAALRTAEHIQGCAAVYVASDEASFLLTDWAQLDTQAWFDYNKSKIESVAASYMSVFFNQNFFGSKEASDSLTDRFGVFDARSFNLPKAEVVNCFLWRMKDWERNSVTMLASEYFTPKELHGKSTVERLQMIEQKKIVRWSDLRPCIRNGSFFVKDHDGDAKFKEIELDYKPNYENISAQLRFLESNPDTL